MNQVLLELLWEGKTHFKRLTKSGNCQVEKKKVFRIDIECISSATHSGHKNYVRENIAFVIPFVRWFIISSPEHEVLMVSYCDQSMCVVCRQQFVLKANSS